MMLAVGSRRPKEVSQLEGRLHAVLPVLHKLTLGSRSVDAFLRDAEAGGGSAEPAPDSDSDSEGATSDEEFDW